MKIIEGVSNEEFETYEIIIKREWNSHQNELCELEGMYLQLKVNFEIPKDNSREKTLNFLVLNFVLIK